MISAVSNNFCSEPPSTAASTLSIDVGGADDAATLSATSAATPGIRGGLRAALERTNKASWNVGAVGVARLSNRELLATFFARLTSNERKECSKEFKEIVSTAPSAAGPSLRRKFVREQEGVIFALTDAAAEYLYMVCIRDGEYPERLAFTLLHEVEERVAAARAADAECSKHAARFEKTLRQPVRKLMATYDQPPGVDAVSGAYQKTEAVKIQMQEVLQKAIRIQGSLESLETRSENLSSRAQTFQRVAAEAQAKSAWQNNILFVLIGLVVAFLFAVPIFFTVGLFRS